MKQVLSDYVIVKDFDGTKNIITINSGALVETNA